MTDTQIDNSECSVIGYEEEIETITDVIKRIGSGALEHIAIISEPMGGRTTLVHEIQRLYKDRVYYFPLEFVITQSKIPDFRALSEDIILIDNCQFLATWKIGGFDLCNHFLNLLISSKKLFVTTWNLFSWQSLSQVLHLDAYFPKILLLNKMDTPVLKQVILSKYKKEEIRFLDDGATERSMFYSKIHKDVSLPFYKEKISIPWIKLNFSLIFWQAPRKNRVQISVEDVIFEKINRIARGNPGVGILLWEEAFKRREISIGSIPEYAYFISLDINESFILFIILSMECIHEIDLKDVAGSEIDIAQTLYRLVQQDLVIETNGYYRISPFALGPVIDYLKKNRRLW
ncbi:MAG: ATP-binding protein [Methanospirillaceae archaeon]|nr:ATP-binding protein [Methanospirillaceae archaeon]